MKIIISIFTALLVATTALATDGNMKQTTEPQSGFIPDAETAITVAMAALIPIYGKDTIQKEEPFTASLSNGVWTVHGSLSKGMVGGVAIAEISQKVGKILRVVHEK